ncbi:retrotransposon-related protein [Tanacetum coccineum]
MADEEEVTGQSGNVKQEDAMESRDISILNSLVDHGSLRSLQLWGMLGSGGCTLLRIIEVTIDIQGLRMDVDLYVLPMKGLDIVLGKQWLQKLGKVTNDYSTQTMEFTCLDQGYTLHGEEALCMEHVSLHHMRILLESEEIYGAYELYNLDHGADENGSSHDIEALMHPNIEQLLAQFKNLFQVPTILPPHRSINHHIHLYPNTKPVNVRPYRYQHYQKGEMEKLVNEMLSQGIIRVSHSPFSSPVLLVKNKDGSYHFCVDYRALNKATIKDKFPIPTADEMFDELGGGDHLFYVKKAKCVFGATTLEYLGHIISGHGVEVDPKKVGRQKGFSALKDKLTHAPILGLPDFKDTFVIEADASAVGIGAVLLQKRQPLDYFSRKLGPRIRIVVTYQKELFVIVEYKPGPTNVVADALSSVFEEDEDATTAFMALSRLIVGLLEDLRWENVTLDELCQIHLRLD